MFQENSEDDLIKLQNAIKEKNLDKVKDAAEFLRAGRYLANNHTKEIILLNCIEEENYEALKYLIDSGIVNIINELGELALITFSERLNSQESDSQKSALEFAKIYIKAGVDYNKKYQDKKTALENFKVYNPKEILDLIEKKEAIKKIISLCASSKNDNMIELLISQTYYEKFDVDFVQDLLKEAEELLHPERVCSLKQICAIVAYAQDKQPIADLVLHGNSSTLEDFTTDGQ